MHQIRFRLGRWGGSLQRSPDPVAGFKGSTSNGKEGRGRERGRERNERAHVKGKKRGKGREEKG